MAEAQQAAAAGQGPLALRRPTPTHRSSPSSCRTARRRRTSTRWWRSATCTSSARRASSSRGSRSRRRTTRSTTRTRCCATSSRVEEVVNSPMVSDPLHRLDCCVMSDGGGALIVARPEIARDIAARQKRPMVKVRGTGEAPKHSMGGRIDLTYSAAAWSGPVAFAEAGVTPADIQYASLYDSFTITVLMQLEDLGFCKKGEGGRFVADGGLISGRRPAAVQHRRRRPVQQPSGEPRRRHQGDRSGAPAARRGASRGAGEELRPGARQRHRRRARVAPHRRHADLGKGVSMTDQDKPARRRPPGRADRTRVLPESQAFWSAADEGRLLLKKCNDCGEVAPLPARHLPASA